MRASAPDVGRVRAGGELQRELVQREGPRHAARDDESHSVHGAAVDVVD